ncbi:MAG: type I restriction endonuclease subunit R, partial [Candidatus Binatia bacterium]
TLYEIISPDPFLREHLEVYGHLSALYGVVRNAFARHVGLYEDVARKTESLVREHVKLWGLEKAMPVARIDEETLDALKRDKTTTPAKVVNLGKGLSQGARQDSDEQPYLLPIGERAEAILDNYDDRQIGTADALRQLEGLLSEYLQARREREESGFDLHTFTIYWVLRQADVPEARSMAPLLEEPFRRFANHPHNADDRRRLKAELYKVLLPVVGKDRMVGLVERLLALHRKDGGG